MPSTSNEGVPTEGDPQVSNENVPAEPKVPVGNESVPEEGDLPVSNESESDGGKLPAGNASAPAEDNSPVVNGSMPTEGKPPAGNESGPAGVTAMGGSCLCLFDIDRTLTGKQGVAFPRCPFNSVQRNVYDSAYGNGDLTLSTLGQNIRSTGCGGCKLGIVSHGTAGGNSMKARIRNLIQINGYIPDHWSYPSSIDSPLVLGCGYKPPCARRVLEWYNRQGAGISPSRVYMFDDKRNNVESFYGSGFNARQVSCSSRDAGEGGQIGYCGGKASEVRLSQGIDTC
jgi:hypothetical protein